MSARPRTDQGFTLLEVLVSVMIFSVAALGTAQAFSTHLSFNSLSEQRTGAISAAQQVLDKLRTQDPADLPNGGASMTEYVVIPPRTYAVKVTFCGDMTYCTAPTVRFLQTVVSLHGRTYYEVDTLFSQLR